MATNWQPAPESLRTLATCLKDSLSGFDMAAQKQAEIMLAQAKKSPDINNYLAYLFSSTTPPQGLNLSEQDYYLVRFSAAIMLKNNIKSEYKQISEVSLPLVRMAALMGVQDQHPQIRSYAGTIITELVRNGGIFAWPEILPELLKMLLNESGDTSEATQQGAMAAMAKICEDNFKTLEREHNGQRPLNFLLPKFIQACQSTIPKVRSQALAAINVFTPRMSQAMAENIDVLLEQLFSLAVDPDADVRRQVCRAFVLLVDTRPDKLLPHISGLVDYIITQQKSTDEELACEAAEFWLSVGEHESLWHALEPYIHKIIPVLLECMVYSGDEIALLGGASDDEDEEDRAQDIRPRFAKTTAARSRAAANGDVTSADAGQNRNAYQSLARMEDDLEEGELEGDDSGDENPDERWTIRKCSAAALDVFAHDFRDPVFECILPYLRTNLRHEEWPYREAAVLALGAVAEGCIAVVTPHLPEIVPYLLTLLNDAEPVVRQITCWTLGRYSAWAASLEDRAQKEAYFVPMMEGILLKMLDKNKKVQEAGASAMANLEEKAGRALEPYAGPIVRQFIHCFTKFKDRNMWILYDCVQTLAEAIGPVLGTPELTNQLMPALIDRWQKVGDQARELFALLECLSYVSLAMGPVFAPYAPPLFRRSVNIIHQNLEQLLAARSNPNFEQPDKDFLVTSLDLLSAITQALDEENAAALVKDSQPAFFELLSLCLEDPVDEVRQSSYALLGDCAKYVFTELQPFLPNIFPIILKQLDLDNILDEEIDSGFGVINNTCWSTGEIALRHRENMGPYVPELFHHCVEIMSNPRVPNSVVENAAITLGRLGIDNAERLAPHLSLFAGDFLDTMDNVSHSEEKATAFQGFGKVVCHNPQAMEKVLLHFFISIARYKDIRLQTPVKQSLHEVFQNIFNIYRQLIPQFGDFINQLSSQDLEALKSNFDI